MVIGSCFWNSMITSLVAQAPSRFVPERSASLASRSSVFLFLDPGGLPGFLLTCTIPAAASAASRSRVFLFLDPGGLPRPLFFVIPSEESAVRGTEVASCFPLSGAGIAPLPSVMTSVGFSPETPASGTVNGSLLFVSKEATDFPLASSSAILSPAFSAAFLTRISSFALRFFSISSSER